MAKYLDAWIPLNDTIKIISSYLYPEGAESCMPFPKKSFEKLMKIATGGLFMHQDRFYTQTDGVAMGNPLGPTLANFFLAHFVLNKFSVKRKQPCIYHFT